MIKIGDKVKALSTIEESNTNWAVNKGDILTIRGINHTSTGIWLTFQEHRVNKYCVYPTYLSGHFK